MAKRDGEGPAWISEALERVAYYWERNVEEYKEARESSLDTIEEENRCLRKAAWRFVKKTDRDTAVSKDEVEAITKQEECTYNELVSTLLCVRFGKITFFRVGNLWTRGISREELTALWRAIASVWGLTHVHASDSGDVELAVTPMPTPTIAQTVKSSVCAKRSTFNPISSTFTEALCPMREDLEPVFDEEVDEWMRALAGEYFTQLELWLVSLGRLDLPSRILFLHGPKRLGKSLLVDGIAQLWDGERAELARVMGTDFNDSISRSPLCVGEESGAGLRGEDLTRWLRKGVADRERTLNRKFAPTTKVSGALRFIIASNNLALITSIKEDLNTDDVDALADRFLHIECSKAALKALKGIDTVQWVEGNRIAQHVLAIIEEHRDYKPTDRFFTAPGSPLLAEVAAMSTGLKGEVMSRVIRCLRDGETPSWIAFRRTGVVVDPGSLHEDSLLPQEQWRCSAAKLGTAVGALACKRTTMPKTKRSGHLILRARVVLFGVVSKLATASELEDAWGEHLKCTSK
jgi:hypothetical protein